MDIRLGFRNFSCRPPPASAFCGLEGRSIVFICISAPSLCIPTGFVVVMVVEVVHLGAWGGGGQHAVGHNDRCSTCFLGVLHLSLTECIIDTWRMIPRRMVVGVL